MTLNNKSTDIYDIAKKLPQTQNLIESLTTIDQTVQEMVEYVAKLEKENSDLRSQLLDTQNLLIKQTEINNMGLKTLNQTKSNDNKRRN